MMSGIRKDFICDDAEELVAWAVAMGGGGRKTFDYSPEELQKIKCAFARMRRVEDADEIGWGKSRLRSEIWISACVHIQRSDPHSFLNRLMASYQPRIASLKALRGKAEILRDAIVASSDSGTYSTSMLGSTKSYINWLSYQIDLLENPVSIERPIAPGSNAALVDREYFWRELIELWCEHGGKPTGYHAADFLIACASPVDATTPDRDSVRKWLSRQKWDIRTRK
jgi:hypothetical protein